MNLDKYHLDDIRSRWAKTSWTDSSTSRSARADIMALIAEVDRLGKYTDRLLIECARYREALDKITMVAEAALKGEKPCI